MLEFEKLEQKKWSVSLNDEVLILNLKSSSVTNKFNIVTDFVKGVNEVIGEDFEKWFFEFVKNYKNEDDIQYLITNVGILKDYVDKYFEISEMDYSKFVDRTKVKKGTILFEPSEIKKIIKVSGYLKIYSFISSRQDIILSNSVHKKIYNMLVEDIMNTDVVYKIFNIVKTKVFRYNLTDRYMWEYIKMIQCKSIDVHTVEIFNFIMNQILILCEEDKNPITYFVGVIEESVKWFLRSVYKKTVVYDDSVSTEDIHGLNVDNLKTYSYNDTLGRLKGIAYDYIYKEIDKSTPMSVDPENDAADKRLAEFQQRVQDIEYISPLSDCLVFPLLSRITNIPYFHFKTLSPEHSMVLSVYLQKLLQQVFKSEYADMFSMLNFYPTSSPAVATTYKIKNVNNDTGFINVQDKTNNFFGFKTKILPYKIMSYFVGRTSRVNFFNIFDGTPYGGIPLSKIEGNMVKFYTLYFSNQLEDKIKELSDLVDLDF
jgi:hypothetical protein